MGASLARGWLAEQKIDLHIVDPVPPPADLAPHVTHHTTITAGLFNVPYDLAVLAVKPDQMAATLLGLAPHWPNGAPLLSIAAGITTATLAAAFKVPPSIIRAMPNLPASVNAGATAIYAPPSVTAVPRDLVTTLFDAVGVSVWVNDESLMDAVTALSGSGPAYVFYLIEVMAQAGVDLGLPADVAMALARQTVIGAALLAADGQNTAAADLRANVTSKGGTTAAALGVLMNETNGLGPLMRAAMLAARDRSRELRG